MSNLNVNQFVNVARQNLDGQVRFSQQDESRLVNKGSLGQRLVDFVKNIGEKLHILRPDPSRSERQRNALKDFTEALTKEYGEKIANQAMQAGNQGGEFTGRTILQVESEAKRLGNEQKKEAEQREYRLYELREQLVETGKFQDLENFIGSLHDMIQRSYDNGHGCIIYGDGFKRAFKDNLDELQRDIGIQKSDLVDLCLEELKGKGGIPPDLKMIFIRAREKARNEESH